MVLHHTCLLLFVQKSYLLSEWLSIIFFSQLRDACAPKEPDFEVILARAPREPKEKRLNLCLGGVPTEKAYIGALRKSMPFCFFDSYGYTYGIQMNTVKNV